MKPDLISGRETPEAMAAYWLNRVRSGEMSVEEVRAFDVWRAREPEHQAAYCELERLWSLAADAIEDPTMMKTFERDARRFNRQARSQVAGLFAAGLTLAAMSGWAIVAAGVLDDFGFGAQPPPQEFKTSIGQRATVTLPDRSVVTLDTDTLLRMRETRRERRIELVRGRAFFEVAKDRSRPFIVAAGGKSVRATGTAFDVRIDPDRFQVTLIEGRVRVEDKGGEAKKAQSAEMRVGWRLVVNADDGQWRMAPVDIARETSWHEGRLSFADHPLAEAVAEMNRYSERKIVFRGTPPKTVIGGVFRAGDLEGFVRAVELNKIARVTRRSEEEIELAAK